MACFIVSSLIPLIVGFIGGIVSRSSMYMDINKTGLFPPGYVFGIVWFILYILMGISSCLVKKSNDKDKDTALSIYAIQLFFNMWWTFIFFNLRMYLLSFFWIWIIIILVVIMIHKFYKINKAAGLLQIPYLIWLIFASYLSYTVYLLN